MIKSSTVGRVPVSMTRSVIRLQPEVSLNRIMHAIAEPEFAAVRKGFLKMPFQSQAEVIGMYSRSMLSKADDLIRDSKITMVPDVTLIWNATLAPGASLSAKYIANVFPNLKQVSEGIEAILQDTFGFWVKEVYSCGSDGKMTVETAEASNALRLNQKAMSAINRESGLSMLGERMKAFANYQWLELRDIR